MTTMTNEQLRAASERVMEHGIPEVPPEEFHKMIQAAWKMPVDKGDAKVPMSGKPMIVGFVAGALCFALGAGFGYFAATDVMDGATYPQPTSGYTPGGDVPADPFVPR